jgi:hypothetical protein
MWFTISITFFIIIGQILIFKWDFQMDKVGPKKQWQSSNFVISFIYYFKRCMYVVWSRELWIIYHSIFYLHILHSIYSPPQILINQGWQNKYTQLAINPRLTVHSRTSQFENEFSPFVFFHIFSIVLISPLNLIFGKISFSLLHNDRWGFQYTIM